MCELLWLGIAGADELKLKSVTECKYDLFNLCFIMFHYLIMFFTHYNVMNSLVSFYEDNKITEQLASF